jgi:hypothetical protein
MEEEQTTQWPKGKVQKDKQRSTKHTHNRGGSRISSWGGAHIKKMPRAEGGVKMFGVFRVNNHDFTPENHIFSNCGGRRENIWGISCEKSRLYAMKLKIE